MKKVLVIGASSRIALWADQLLAADPTIDLTLFLRHPDKLPAELQMQKVVVGDATNRADVQKAVAGMDVVYASLAGDVQAAATTLVQAMDEAGVKRLIWTSSLGIYNEIPGEFGCWNQQVMGDYYRRYRLAADVIEGSDLDYTIIWPAWLTNLDEVDYETTLRDEPFKGTEVSRKSVASLAVSVIKDPAKFVRESVGVDKPGTAADRPRTAVMRANGGYEQVTRKEIKLRFP